MDFGLSDAQTLLQDSVKSFLAQNVPLERVRRVMEGESGTDRQIHRLLGEQGLAGILVPEARGGSGLELLDASVVAQELGRAAAPVSYHSAYMMAPLLLRAAGNEDLQSQWLPRIADGTALISVVVGELSVNDGKLEGEARLVADGELADAFIVQANDNGSSTLVLVPSDRQGIETRSLPTIDETRRCSEVRFSELAIGDADRLCCDDDEQAFERALEAGRTGLAADALGAAQEALRLAVEYAKQRQQFGRIIASFQAVKHMCAETIAAVDPVQSLLWSTAWSWDQEMEDAHHLVPILKAHASEVATDAVATCTQVFGGIGFTHECDVHIYFKRAGYDRQILGGPTALRRMAADLQFP